MFMEFPSKNCLKARRRDLSGFFFKLSEFAGLGGAPVYLKFPSDSQANSPCLICKLSL